MKTIPQIILAVFIFISSCCSIRATIHTITVAYGPGFTPDTAYVIVGDTIHWKWEDSFAMSHTTTVLNMPIGATFWDATLDATDTIFEYIISVAGTYHYHCTFHSFSSVIIAGTPASINESIKINQSFANIYPNPNQGKFFLEGTDIIRIEIFDFLGRKINTTTSIVLQNILEIDISGNASGMYFAIIIGKQKKQFCKVEIKEAGR